MGHPRIILRPTPMLRKQVGQLKKMMDTWKPSKLNKEKLRPRSYPTQVQGVPDFMAQHKGIHSKQITRRQIVLNRTFTEVLSDIVSTSMGDFVQKNKITITSIETKAWNKGVRIFYVTDDSFDQVIHDELNLLCPQLRYAIAEQRILGRIPLVSFVYDQATTQLRELDKLLGKVDIKESKEEDLVSIGNSELQSKPKSSGSTRHKIAPREFNAPPDMQNHLLGIDYAAVYNKIVPTLERGRAQSARMIPEATLEQQIKPIFRMPIDDGEEDEHPSLRLARMQKFVVDQRKKDEYHGKLRRKEQLIYRDKIKWDPADENVEDDRNLADPNDE